MCQIFADVLNVSRVGLDDDFFNLEDTHSCDSAGRPGAKSIRRGAGHQDAVRRTDRRDPRSAAAGADPSRARRSSVKCVPVRLPLSFAQARLWFLHRLEGPSATYNIPLALRLRGALDADALQAALCDTVARHESLRTILPDDDGEPYQRILVPADARPPIVRETIATGVVGDRLLSAAATALDPTREIPIRAWLFQVAPDEHVFLLLLHHIAGDGWSLAPLMRDLGQAYAARLLGEHPAWADLPVRYARLRFWQRRTLGDERDLSSEIGRQLAYWRATLDGLPDELSLPADHHRTPRATYRGGTVALQIDAALHARLLATARDGGASLFMVLQAGLAAMLSRLGAGDDIAIGTPIAGRGEPALERLVGFFVNTLVLRTDLSGNPSFRALLARVRTAALDAYAHQDLPFERLVEALHPARSLARHPLFQVMLVLQNLTDAAPTFTGLTVEAEPVRLKIAKFDLTITFAERRGPDGRPDGIAGLLEYNRDRFEPDTAGALAQRFARILAALVDAPDRPIRQVDLLTPAERQWLLDELNATTVPVASTTLPELFEAQVARTPSGIAIVDGRDAVWYGDLNTRANRLAHLLLARGVGPNQLVGVCLDRSASMVASLIAILKIGAAYVPLDPAYPAARLAHIVADADPIVILASARHRERLPDRTTVLLLDADDSVAALAAAPDRNLVDTDRGSPLDPGSPRTFCTRRDRPASRRASSARHRASSTGSPGVGRAIRLARRMSAV